MKCLGNFQDVSLHYWDILELTQICPVCPAHPLPSRHPVLELPPLSPFVSPPRLGPSAHFLSWNSSPSHSLGPSQLINRSLVLLLICISSLDGTWTLCYTPVPNFFVFFAVCFSFGFGVLISKSFKFRLDFIWKVASIKRWHKCLVFYFNTLV